MVEDYVIFRDVLSNVFIVLAMLLTVVSITLYEIISKSVMAKARSDSEKVMRKMGAQILGDVGYIFWRHYQETSHEKETLNRAIEITEDAYYKYARDLDGSGNELLIYNLKNNLAYYYAQRENSADATIARDFAEELQKKSSEFESSIRDKMNTTYEYVQKKFPKHD